MLDCLEFLDDIVEIYTVAGDVLTFPMPFNVAADEMNIADIHVGDAALTLEWLRTQQGLVVEGVEWRNQNARTLIMNPRPKVKSTPKNSIAGDYFNVSISAKTYADVGAVRSAVRAIQAHDYFDTFIVDADENVYLLRGVFPATSIKYTAELPRYNEIDISIDVECVNGLQLLLQS